MALIDVISWDGGVDELVWKFPSSNLRLGSQLIVKPGQVAFFVYRGQICDEIGEGSITLTTFNIPFLTKLTSIPFGGKSPFEAEVYFVNTLAKLDMKWGTPSTIQVEDGRYGIVVPIRAYGQFGVLVSNARVFLTKIVGAMAMFTADQLAAYFRGKIVSTISTQIGTLFNERVSFLNVAGHLEEMSQSALLKMRPLLAEYGIGLETFFFESINIPDSDPSLLRLKQIKEKAAELSVVGRDIYQLDKSMEVLKAAAGNTGIGGSVMQASLGAGMGVVMGAHLGQQANQMTTRLPTGSGLSSAPPPPEGISPLFFVVMQGQQAGPFPASVLQQLLSSNSISPSSLVWRTGMPIWQAASDVPELAHVFSSVRQAPPPIPT